MGGVGGKPQGQPPRVGGNGFSDWRAVMKEVIKMVGARVAEGARFWWLPGEFRPPSRSSEGVEEEGEEEAANVGRDFGGGEGGEGGGEVV